MTSSEINLVMTVVGFAVSTLFIVFVCTRLVCARIQFRAARRSFERPFRSDLSTMERGFHGLDAPALAKFPAKNYVDQYFAAGDAVQCSICLQDYGKEDVLRILPQCGHYFHINCIDIWLIQHSTCPVCRISLRDSMEKKHSLQPMFSSRIRFNADSTNIHTYSCLLGSHRFQSSASEENNGRSDPVQEEGSPSISRTQDIEETGESVECTQSAEGCRSKPVHV